MYVYNVVMEELCQLWSVGGVIGGDEVSHFRVSVDNDEDRVEGGRSELLEALWQDIVGLGEETRRGCRGGRKGAEETKRGEKKTQDEARLMLLSRGPGKL